ncbi:MAG TPA: hypothetical protein VOA87_22655 [Thermoanaerobaculia bacterium]|nr:hypothetical protein [Thermoanaerobaculia bacterium]
MKTFKLVLGLLLTTASVAYGQATQVVDLSTGVANGGGGLIAVATNDPKWQLEVPGGTFAPVPCTNGSLIDLFGTLHPNTWASDPSARWLSPYIDTSGNATSPSGGLTGDFIYRTTFVAPSCKASNVLVSLAKLGGDNTVTGLSVNSHPVHPLNATFNPLSSATINISTSELVIGGNNTLDITVNNQGSYTGLFVHGNLAITYPDCPSVGVNKDLVNSSGQVANDIEIVLAGSFANVNHYDGYAANLFASFTESPGTGGTTLLKWSHPNNPVQPGQIAHVGFNLPGSSSVSILGVFWTLNGQRTGCAQQVSTNTHQWGSAGSQIIYVNNERDCNPIPRYVGGLTVEWHARQVPLADLNAKTRRKPIRTDVINRPPIRLAPEATATVNVPEAPPNALFGVVVQKVSTNARLSGPDVTTDFLEFPVVKRKAQKVPATGAHQMN